VPSLDRLERLTDLVLVLLRAPRPMTLEAIADEIPGYPEEHDARRQAFERDKRLLRDEGIPVATEPVEGQEQFGYRIHADAFYLPDLQLQPDEQAALHLAVAGVHLGDPSGRHALLKLGAMGLAEARPVASLVPPPALVPLFEAVRSRADVVFEYRGESRRVSPAGLWFRSGRWYLIGWDRVRGAERTFRVDRITGRPDPQAAGTAHLPEGFDPDSAVPDDPWRAGDGEDGDVTVWVDPIEAPRVVEEVGERAVVERGDEGSVLLRLGISSPEAFRSWVLGLLDHAEVVAPPAVRGSMLQWLEDTAAAAGRVGSGSSGMTGAGKKAGAQQTGAQKRGIAKSKDDRAGTAPTRAPSGEADPTQAGSAARGRDGRDASSRLRRLLAMMAWLARVGEAPIAEIATRFGLSEDEVVRELELAACCGLPPYSPDVLMEIVVTDEVVRARLPEDLARPRRLTAAEGFAVLAAGRTILAVPGADEEGSLARALDKLETVLGNHSRVVVAIDTPSLLPDVRAAVDDHRQIEIEYHSASSDETTHRVIDPHHVVSLDGHWYLDAYCDAAGGERRFRVDRIRSVRATGGDVAPTMRPARSSTQSEAFVPGPGSTAVTLTVDEEAAWIVDTVPTVDVELSEDGTMRVTLAVGGMAWLERLLLQLGPHASVVDPPNLIGLGAAAADRLAQRYRSAP
jgi:predicted DNA-binding transcriptional regulator YafY